MAAPRAQYAHDWYKANLDENRRKRRESTQRYRACQSAAGLEKERAYAREHLRKSFAQNPERILARNRQWSKDNQDVVQAKNARHRAAKLKAMPTWLTTEQHQMIRAFYQLAQATGLTVDHIVPLQGKTVCGLHVPWNLQLLPRRENCSKRNKL